MAVLGRAGRPMTLRSASATMAASCSSEVRATTGGGCTPSREELKRLCRVGVDGERKAVGRAVKQTRAQRDVADRAIGKTEIDRHAFLEHAEALFLGVAVRRIFDDEIQMRDRRVPRHAAKDAEIGALEKLGEIDLAGFVRRLAVSWRPGKSRPSDWAARPKSPAAPSPRPPSHRNRERCVCWRRDIPSHKRRCRGCRECPAKSRAVTSPSSNRRSFRPNARSLKLSWS